MEILFQLVPSSKSNVALGPNLDCQAKKKKFNLK